VLQDYLSSSVSPQSDRSFNSIPDFRAREVDRNRTVKAAATTRDLFRHSPLRSQSGSICRKDTHSLQTALTFTYLPAGWRKRDRVFSDA